MILSWEQLLDQQRGVVSRTQCSAYGLTDDAVAWRLEKGAWRCLHPGVYVTHTGPVETVALCWAAVLFAGDGAAVGHESAAWLWGFLPYRTPLRVAVPHTRRVAALDGVRLIRTRRLEPRIHPRTKLPVTSQDDTVLDLVDEATDLDRVLAVIADAVQKRATNPFHLREAAARRRKLRWRAEFEAVLADVRAGAETPLEIAYLRRVERAHHLPSGRRQQGTRIDGRLGFIDVLYDAYALVVELDGRLGHDNAEGRFRDMHRDNAATEAGRAALRYGWSDVLARSCQVAGQVAGVLKPRGWAGQPQRCGSTCGL